MDKNDYKIAIQWTVSLLYLFQRSHWCCVATQHSQCKSQCLPHFITEVSAAQDLRGGQTDVFSWKRKQKRVGHTVWR